MRCPPGLAVRIGRGMRACQEDHYGFLPLGESLEQGLLLVLADGMGGHTAGALASETAVAHFINSWREHGAGAVCERLERALVVANDSVRRKVAADPALEGMGCTLVGAVVIADAIQWISVGDSPLWVWQRGELLRLNEDHSMAPLLQNLVEAGRLGAEEAAADPRRNALRSAVMGNELELIDRPEKPLPLDESACVLLASDGLQTLGDDEIAAIVRQSAALGSDACAERLMAAVAEKRRPDQDNVTVLVYTPRDPSPPHSGDLTGVSLPEEPNL